MTFPSLTIAFQTNKPLNVYGRLARRVEEYGFDGVTVYNDMLYQPAWLPLLEIARHTERVRIGPAAVNPFTCHPVNIAANIALIEEASNGRSYLGLARGAWLDLVGLEPQSAPRQLQEAMACVRHLLQGKTTPLPGDFFSLAAGAAFRWPNINPDIPFLLGSWGPQTIETCLSFVEEIKLGGTANPEAVRWLRQKTGNAAAIVAGAVTVVAEDRAEALALARREAALYIPVIAPLDPTLAIDPDRLARIETAAKQHDWETAAAAISNELLHQFAFAGTPQDIVSQTQVLFDAGADRIEYGTPHGITTADGLCLLGEQVLPVVRQSL